MNQNKFVAVVTNCLPCYCICLARSQLMSIHKMSKTQYNNGYCMTVS